MRPILDGYKKGNKRCRLALAVFCYRVKKYIAAYAAALGNVDAVVFTAGTGENAPLIRDLSASIACLGIRIDAGKNKKTIAKEGIISSKNSRIKVFVIPTDEEKMIAIETKKLIRK